MSCEVNGTQKISIELSKYEKSKKNNDFALGRKIIDIRLEDKGSECLFISCQRAAMVTMFLLLAENTLALFSKDGYSEWNG